MNDNLIKAKFYAIILYSFAYPTIQITLMQVINSKLLALSTICGCLSSIILGKLWNKYKNKLYKFTNIYLISEVIGEIIIAVIAIKTGNYIVYYILSMFISSIITTNIVFSTNILIAKRYITEDEKIKYSNDSEIYYSLATLIGATSAILINVPLWLSFIFMSLGMTIDNWFYYKEYIKLKEVDAHEKRK